MSKPLNILLVEDDAIEVMKFNRVIKGMEKPHRVMEAGNGEEALNILKDREVNPDIIVLDLNMPKLNGIEFLRILKQDEQRRFIPTIILTTSSNYTDVKECYNIGVAGYVVKPLKYDDYISNTQKLIEYWSNNELIS